MPLKYVYVLVSGEKDYYYEQCLLSVTSLRLVMPDALVSVLADNLTAASMKGRRAKLKEIVNELKVVDFPDNMNAKERSRRLKTSMRRHITGDFLFIDCDTIIAADLSTIQEIDADLAAVPDGHCLIQNHRVRKAFTQSFNKAGFLSLLDIKKYFNSGVVFCRDNELVHHFFDDWERLYIECASKDVTQDMPAMNQANLINNNIIKEIDGIWNCQITFSTMMQYISNAKIIHYFATSDDETRSYFFANIPVYQSVKKRGVVPDDILEKLRNPIAAFDEQNHFVLASLSERVYKNIKNREGLTLKFIIKCFLARFLRGMGVKL